MFGSAQLLQHVDLSLQRKHNEEDFLQLSEEWDNKNWWAKVEHHSLWEKVKNKKGIKILWSIGEYWRYKILGVKACVVWLSSWIEDIHIDIVWFDQSILEIKKKQNLNLILKK